MPSASVLTLQVEYRVAWWFELYLYGLVTAAWLMNAQPDEEKVFRTILRAIKWRFVGTRRWHSMAPT